MNLAAYTGAGTLFPPYISINYRNTMVEITVRGAPSDDGREGATAVIKMNLHAFGRLCDEARSASFNLPAPQAAE